MTDTSNNQQDNSNPTSTVTRSFADSLDTAFSLGDDPKHLVDLSHTVEEKKRDVSTKSKELEELEARIQAAEQRLKQAGTSGPKSDHKDVRDVFPDQTQSGSATTEANGTRTS